MKAWLGENHSFEEFIRTVLAIDNEADAKSFFDWVVAYIQTQQDRAAWESRLSPIETAQSNIGWCFGEGMSIKRMKMWIKVCGASHPIFGQTIPTLRKAFRMGQMYGKTLRKEKK